MRSVKEWHDELLALMNRPPSFAYCSASIEDIARIQADAFRHAAAIAMRYNENPQSDDAWFINVELEKEAERVEKGKGE